MAVKGVVVTMDDEHNRVGSVRIHRARVEGRAWERWYHSRNFEVVESGRCLLCLCCL